MNETLKQCILVCIMSNRFHAVAVCLKMVVCTLIILLIFGHHVAMYAFTCDSVMMCVLMPRRFDIVSTQLKMANMLLMLIIIITYSIHITQTHSPLGNYTSTRQHRQHKCLMR